MGNTPAHTPVWPADPPVVTPPTIAFLSERASSVVILVAPCDGGPLGIRRCFVNSFVIILFAVGVVAGGETQMTE